LPRVAVSTDAYHQFVVDDAAEHPPVEKKGKPAEHRFLGDTATSGDNGSDPVREFLVVGHGA
jgi:hypothetical protein